ncbi:hypothetical protein Bpfe_028720 [Biomphalaria pfeifferi]|uniref:Uncharacterized protein n=1 Tax=Biomphalaria pfeifferi TaxID=112525 RepID=A0AAD8AU11_BIOPF|nr:hypothetical protein Bpfe_028720 [Biomphalaria pfeifferi]
MGPAVSKTNTLISSGRTNNFCLMTWQIETRPADCRNKLNIPWPETSSLPFPFVSLHVVWLSQRFFNCGTGARGSSTVAVEPGVLQLWYRS